MGYVTYVTAVCPNCGKEMWYQQSGEYNDITVEPEMIIEDAIHVKDSLICCSHCHTYYEIKVNVPETVEVTLVKYKEED